MTLKIKGGIPFSKQLSELMKQAKLSSNLPFKATGWNSSKMPKGITEKNIETGEMEIDVEKVIGTAKPEEVISVTPEKKYMEKLIDIKGVGEEIAEEIMQLFPNWDAFVDKVTTEDLIDISGIGKRKANKIIKQIRGLK